MNTKLRENTQWITNILTSIGVIAAIAFSFYNSQYKPNEANLQISESYLKEYRKVVAYNGGQGLCLDFSLHFPEVLKSAWLFSNYEETSLTNVEVACEQKNTCTSVIPRIKTTKLSAVCKNDVCTSFIGVLKPNESIAFLFENILNNEVSVSCVDQQVNSQN